MEAAHVEAGRGAAEGTLIIAERQTAGRGRMQRAWVTPEGSLAISVVLKPPITRLPSLIMIASVAVARTIKHMTGLNPGIKWPNDVLLKGKKVCGILIENRFHGSELQYSIVGIGLNVNVTMTEYSELTDIAISMSDAVGHSVSRLETLRRLMVEMESLYLASSESVFAQWKARLITLGNPVTIRWGDGVYTGIAEDVASDGALLLRQAGGELIKVVAGDATLRL